MQSYLPPRSIPSIHEHALQYTVLEVCVARTGARGVPRISKLVYASFRLSTLLSITTHTGHPPRSITMSSPMPSSPLHTLFLTEAILKILGGATFILFPSSILKNLIAPPYTPALTLLVRCLGTQTLAFSIPLFLAARSHGLGKEGRRLVYWSVLAREGFLMIGLLGGIAGIWSRGRAQDGLRVERSLEEGKGGESRAAEEDQAVEQRMLQRGSWLWVAELVPFVVGRVWILTQKEEWF